MKKTLLSYAAAIAFLVAFELTGGTIWAIGAILALIAGFFIDPFGLLCLIALVLPFSLSYMQIEIGIVTFNPFSLGVLAVAVLSLVRIGTRKLTYTLTSDDYLIGALSLAFLISTLFAEDVIEAGFLAFHGIFIPVITYFVIKSNVRRADQAKKILVFFVIGITAFAAVSLFEFSTSATRLRGAQSSISIAGMSTTAIIIIGATNWRKSLVGRLAMVVCAAALVASFSRGYLVLLVLSPAIFLIVRKGKSLALITVVIFGSLIGTIMLATSAELVDVELGMEQRKSEQDFSRVTDTQLWLASIVGRGYVYNAGLKSFTNSPIIGNGFHKGTGYFGTRAVVWHNFHVEWLEYGGLIAYLLYVGLLISHFKGCARLATLNRLVAANLTIICVLLVNALTNSFTAGMTPYLAYFLLGMNNAIQIISKRAALQRNYRDNGVSGRESDLSLSARL